MKLSKKIIVLLFPLLFITNTQAMLRSGARSAARAAAACGVARGAAQATGATGSKGARFTIERKMAYAGVASLAAGLAALSYHYHYHYHNDELHDDELKDKNRDDKNVTLPRFDEEDYRLAVCIAEDCRLRQHLPTLYTTAIWFDKDEKMVTTVWLKTFIERNMLPEGPVKNELDRLFPKIKEPIYFPTKGSSLKGSNYTREYFIKPAHFDSFGAPIYRTSRVLSAAYIAGLKNQYQLKEIEVPRKWFYVDPVNRDLYVVEESLGKLKEDFVESEEELVQLEFVTKVVCLGDLKLRNFPATEHGKRAFIDLEFNCFSGKTAPDGSWIKTIIDQKTLKKLSKQCKKRLEIHRKNIPAITKGEKPEIIPFVIAGSKYK